jgi:hypothetical protein
MNAPGSCNGALQVWIATYGPASEQPMVDRPDMEWRNAETFGVDGLYFDTFHGGDDATWAPTRTFWTEFSEIGVTKRP